MSSIVIWTGAYGSYGAIQGAKTATTTANSSMAAPTVPMR